MCAEFNQVSFKGGMNLLVDDTRLAVNEYREAFNIRNRFDVLDQIFNPITLTAPTGLKQGIITFGDYIILFVAGKGYYKFRNDPNWTKIPNFGMSATAPRYWMVQVPTATTLFGRVANPTTFVQGAPTISTTTVNPDPGAGIKLFQFSSSGPALGNVSGLLVQDGVNQPQFIYVDQNSTVQCRTTQTYAQWSYDPTGVADAREYVPIGTYMEWFDGILFIVDPTFSIIYRSVSGRPLDFVINVTPATAAGSWLDGGNKGGDASTTAYSVGLGGITSMRSTSSDTLFIATSSQVCFAVSINRTPGAPTLFGEPSFIRNVLFTAGCLNEKCFIDILGDYAFIDVDGLRSYNAVLQDQNEGRNSIFSLKVAPLFQSIDPVTKKKSAIVQDPTSTAAIVYDNYALFSVNTVYGNVIIVYDTLNQCYCGMDLQTGGVAITQFAKIETDTLRLYCITKDNRVMQLYGGTTYATSTFRSQSICSSLLYANMNINMQNPKSETRLQEFRCVLTRFWAESTITASFFVNARLSVPAATKTFTYTPPSKPYTQFPTFSDVDSDLVNVLFTTPNCGQGWKVFAVLSWTGGGSITNIAAMLEDLTPKQPLKTQSNILSATAPTLPTPQIQ